MLRWLRDKMSRIVNKMSRLVVILSVALRDIALQQRNQRDYKFYFFHLCVSSHSTTHTHTHTHTHTRLTAIFRDYPGEPVGLPERQNQSGFYWSKRVSGSGISWNICKSAPRSRQITMPTPHHSVFYRPDALPAAQPTASKHWRINWQTQW